ncbi:hypothetical protein GmHk_02G005142 [Glycine max]|nr:hypothetical protein GmHk_02G005142 [Glycine max]
MRRQKKLEEVAQFRSTETVINSLSPIRRHVKWKMTYTKKTGQMTSEVAKQIANKIISHVQLIIDSLEEQTSQGSFVAHGRQEVLTVAIGRPEHPGRVRVAGAGVTIKQYFGPAPRISHTSSSMAPEELEQLTRQISDQLEESITEKELALPLEPEVGPSAARVRTKEICVDPSGNDPNTSDSNKCGLYIEQNPPRLVALEKVYEGSTSVHNIPLLHDQVKVGVEEVRDAKALIPVPTEEGAVGPTKPADRPDHEVDDPLYLMTLIIPQLFFKPLQVMWDATVHMTKTSMRAGNSDVYGFLEPQSIQRSRQPQFESDSYMKKWMQNSKRDVYLGAYLNA